MCLRLAGQSGKLVSLVCDGKFHQGMLTSAWYAEVKNAGAYHENTYVAIFFLLTEERTVTLQTSSLQWVLTAIPAMKSLVMSLSFVFWYGLPFLTIFISFTLLANESFSHRLITVSQLSSTIFTPGCKLSRRTIERLNSCWPKAHLMLF